jgi:glycosyltransferase involved in cell wall biosynthesis
VTTSVSGIPELVGDDGGIMVAPADAAAVAEAMARVLDDDALARRLAERGRARVARDFDLHLEAAKLGDLFAASVDRGT